MSPVAPVSIDRHTSTRQLICGGLNEAVEDCGVKAGGLDLVLGQRPRLGTVRVERARLLAPIGVDGVYAAHPPAEPDDLPLARHVRFERLHACERGFPYVLDHLAHIWSPDPRRGGLACIVLLDLEQRPGLLALHALNYLRYARVLA